MVEKVKFKKVWVGLAIVVMLATALRVYRLSGVPASLYYDEVDYGYQARGLIETGKDYRGGWSPFYVHSFNDIRAPIPAYLTVLASLIFQTPELAVRMPSAVLGVGVVVLVFWLVRCWTGNEGIALVGALVVATSPWQLQYSRFSHEGISMAAVYTAGVGLWFEYWRRKKYIWLVAGVAMLSLGVYTYRPMSLYVPLTMGILGMIYFKDLWKLGIKKLVLLVATAGIIIVPFIYATTWGAPDIPRINQLAIFADPKVPIGVMRNREVDSGDLEDSSLGKQATKTSFFFHSKPVSWLDALANNYLRSFSWEFLLVSGDRNPRHNVGQMGHLLVIEIVGLMWGLAWVVKRLKEKIYQWLLVWLLTAPIPAALTVDGATHASRLFLMSVPLLIIVGLGWWNLGQFLKTGKWRRWLAPMLAGSWLLLLVFYLHRYYVHYPIESARYFGYGFKQAVAKMVEVDSEYDKVMMADSYDPPMIYYLFWSRTPPVELQNYGSQFSPDVIKGQLLDKYKVAELKFKLDEPMAEQLEERTLYLITDSQINMENGDRVPEGVNLIDVIDFPDKTPAFYLIARAPS